MKRTPIMRRYEDALALINDQLCFAALASHEFSWTVDILAAEKAEEFTTAVFPENPNTKRLFRKVKDLAAFASKAEVIAYRMGVVFGYEHLAAYLEDALDFRKAIQPSPQDKLTYDALEETVAHRLQGWSPGAVKQDYFRTVGYLRHLRNSFAHAHDGPSAELASYAAVHAHALNKFWDNGRTEIGEIDFRTLPSEDMTAGSAYALMNLTRICAREIDQQIAGTLTNETVLNIALDDAWKQNPNIGVAAARLAAKARGYIEAQFGDRLPKELVIANADEFIRRRTAARRR